MASEFFGRQRECRFYTAGCGNKMEVSVTGPRAVNELGGPVIPGKRLYCMDDNVSAGHNSYNPANTAADPMLF